MKGQVDLRVFPVELYHRWVRLIDEVLLTLERCDDSPRACAELRLLVQRARHMGQLIDGWPPDPRNLLDHVFALR